MADMTRAQYLQWRSEVRSAQVVVQEIPLADVIATIDAALKAGPAQSPQMWAEGEAQLHTDRALAVAALTAFPPRKK